MSSDDRKSGSGRVSLWEASRVWAKIGIVSFGGPAAQIALMHKVIVEENVWMTERRFLNALNFCMLLPGPEAMQLATYAGWKLHGIIGGLVAGLLFVLPGAAIILALSIMYSLYGEAPLVEALFFGIKAAVLVIVLEALIKVTKRALHGAVFYTIAALSFLGIYFLQVPYPLIVIAAGAIGMFLIKDVSSANVGEVTYSQPVPYKSTLLTVSVCLFIWALPIVILWSLDVSSILVEIAFFFSKLAVVTFGGAYAVLAYMAQDVVDTNGWLMASEMVDGLGLAETTPGPLILVTEFVGFLAAERVGGIWLGVLGALITLWVTFVPCFLWIFAGAPYIDKISSQPRLRGALSAITAAVVGVILNISIWFAAHVLFSTVSTASVGPLTFAVPEFGSLDWRALMMAISAGLLLLVLRLNLILVLAIAATGGVALSMI